MVSVKLYNKKMKKILIFIICFLLISLGSAIFRQRQPTRTVSPKPIFPTQIPTPSVDTPIKETSAIFVPYWYVSAPNTYFSQYDRIIYFGVSANTNGVDRNEVGYQSIEAFLSAVPDDKKRLLTLRMLNTEAIYSVLENEKNQDTIIEETVNLAKQYAFDGIVLDLELSSSLKTDTAGNINKFVQQFYSGAKKYYIPFSVLVYGDIFYRGRPYDLAFLAKNSDEIMIMAYDFHKSGGEPGPNFPFGSNKGQEYNFQRMISDFISSVPKEKITVVFGMFGYDWLVDERKLPIRPAKALSLNEIHTQFFPCDLENCLVRRDETSSETEINYIISAKTPDEQGVYRIDYHIVWFEDEESVAIKKEWLREKGMVSTAYWAYGYF